LTGDSTPGLRRLKHRIGIGIRKRIGKRARKGLSRRFAGKGTSKLRTNGELKLNRHSQNNFNPLSRI
jgi:hypothetical protein